LDCWPLHRLELPPRKVDTPAHLRRLVAPLIVEKIPLFILSALSSIITVVAQREGGALIDIQKLGFGERLANALTSYTNYILKMGWPYDLAVFYPHSQTILFGQAVGSFLVLFLVTFWVVRKWRGAPFLAVGWFWYLGTLAPVIGIVQVGSQAMADRYTYIPLIGLFIMIAWGTPDLMVRGGAGNKKTILALAAGIILLNLAVTSWAHVKYWRNSLSLFQHAIDVTKDNHVAHNQLGKMYSLLSMNEQAERHFREALRITPSFYSAHQNWGNHLAFQKRYAEAIAHYREALKIKDDPVIHNGLGYALASTGKSEEAMVHYRKALFLKHDFSTACINLADLLTSLGRYKEAGEYYHRALRLDPGDEQASKGLRNLKARSGH
jgi:protein O-mannosyl-transferase